jgi:hypothetical protein
MREKSEQQRLLSRLSAAGCPLDQEPLEEEKDAMEFVVHQTGEAYLFELKSPGSAIVMDICIGRQKPGEGTIRDFGALQGPWGVWHPIWCAPLKSGKGVYRLRNGDEFERDLVLNDQLDAQGIRLRRGEFVEGYVLGYAPNVFPAEFRHRMLVDARFSVADFLGRESVGEVRFMVDRSDLMQAPIFRNSRPAAGVRSYTPTSKVEFEAERFRTVRKGRGKPSSSNG